MKKTLDKRVKYIIITLLLFIVLNIALTYAYIRAGSVGSESVSTVALKAGGLYVKYENNSGDIVVSDIVPGFSTTKKFSVTSKYDSKKDYYSIPLWYTIKLIVEKNEFDNNSIKYSIKLDESSGKDGIPFENNLEEGILKGPNLEGITIGSGAFYNDNQTHVYNLIIRYPETKHNQTHEIDCEFSAHVAITNPTLINATFDLDGGTPDGIMLDSSNSMKIAANSKIYFSNFLDVINGDGDYNSSNGILKTFANNVALKVVYITTDFDYTGGEQEFIANVSGYYKLETWGAQGVASVSRGGYTSGELFLQKNDLLYVYVGQGNNKTGNGTSFNSGTGSSGGYPGGGASDIRLIGGAWNNINSLISRIMVAGGSGSGSGNSKVNLGAGGGLNGYAGGGTAGGTQTTFGTVQSSSYTASSFGVANGGCAGGNGYYPGGGATCSSGAGGGSSYISGHTGCVAIESDSSTTARTGTDGASCTTGTTDNLCSVHYSGKVFTDTVMIDGAGYSWTNTKGELMQMPNPSGGYYDSGVGHSGNGYARITFLHR